MPISQCKTVGVRSSEKLGDEIPTNAESRTRRLCWEVKVTGTKVDNYSK